MLIIVTSFCLHEPKWLFPTSFLSIFKTLYLIFSLSHTSVRVPAGSPETDGPIPGPAGWILVGIRTWICFQVWMNCCVCVQKMLLCVIWTILTIMAEYLSGFYNVESRFLPQNWTNKFSHLDTKTWKQAEWLSMYFWWKCLSSRSHLSTPIIHI